MPRQQHDGGIAIDCNQALNRAECSPIIGRSRLASVVIDVNATRCRLDRPESKLSLQWKIRLPNALPSLFAGMKVGISFALVGAIVGEFVAGSDGLGTVILIAEGRFDTTRVFAALVMLGVMATVMFYAVNLVETLLLPWHASHRGRAPR